MAPQNNFLINTWNHGENPYAAADMFRYLRNGLALAGQSVGVSPTLFHNANLINVMVEQFSVEEFQDFEIIYKN